MGDLPVVEAGDVGRKAGKGSEGSPVLSSNPEDIMSEIEAVGELAVQFRAKDAELRTRAAALLAQVAAEREWAGVHIQNVRAAADRKEPAEPRPSAAEREALAAEIAVHNARLRETLGEYGAALAEAAAKHQLADARKAHEQNVRDLEAGIDAAEARRKKLIEEKIDVEGRLNSLLEVLGEAGAEQEASEAAVESVHAQACAELQGLQQLLQLVQPSE